MKTTLDLPHELVREMKLRAAHEGRKIKDVVASLLVSGLAAEAAKIKATQTQEDLGHQCRLFPTAKQLTDFVRVEMEGVK
jgi:plasmid stability protein